VSVFHIINIIGYLITIIPLPEGMDVEVHIPNENADDAETDEAGEA
jgi:hypothetical protein